MAKLDAWGAFVDRPTPPGGETVAEPATGPLVGLRLAVKDNIAVAGLRWTAGLPLFADRIAARDAACVATLRSAGANVVGTVTTDSAGFGMMTPSVVNPLAAERTVGGSSGGSAAAVASGLADIALGTDTAGSVRVPAACCGLYGLKPSYGRIPVDGVTPLSATFDHVGLLAADLDTLERTTRVLLPGAQHATPALRRIGFDPERLAGTDAVIRAGIERALAWLTAQGHTLVEIELPDRLQLAEIHGTIVCADARAHWRQHWPRDADRFSDTARRSLAYADTIAADAIAEARVQLDEARALIDQAFDTADVVIGPTIAVPPPRVGARRVTFCGIEAPVVFALLAETCPFNVSGAPALAMPLPWLESGIPLSLQIAAPRGHDLDTIALARVLATMGSAS